MRCDELHRLSDRLADGGLNEDERARVARHAAGCPDCRELVRLATGAGEPGADEVDLVSGVMARTAGDPCATARQRLCRRVDGESGPLDRELIDAHLDSCGVCRGMAATLATLRTELPALAVVDPGEGFTRAVLARTSRTRRRPPGVRFVSWLTEGGRLLQRPRLALEVAYVVSLLATLLIVTPGGGLERLPDRALSLARRVPPLELRRHAVRLEVGVRDRVESGLSFAHGGVSAGIRFSETIRAHAGTFASRLASNTTNAERSATPATADGVEP